MTNHDCTRHCTPDTCKVMKQERFMDRRDGDDGLPTKCCGRCVYLVEYEDQLGGYGCYLKHHEDDDSVDPTDYCLAFELKDF